MFVYFISLKRHVVVLARGRDKCVRACVCSCSRKPRPWGWVETGGVEDGGGDKALKQVAMNCVIAMMGTVMVCA